MSVIYRQLILQVSTIAVIIATSGCTFIAEPAVPPSAPARPVLSPAEQNIGGDTSGGAVNAALMWEQKYRQLAGQTDELENTNKNLAGENDALKKENQLLKSQLDQAKKQLAEAEQFILQSHQELVAWKSDVLGFRDEMRNADSAQLQALTQILKILGAETTTQPVQQKQDNSNENENDTDDI